MQIVKFYDNKIYIDCIWPFLFCAHESIEIHCYEDINTGDLFGHNPEGWISSADQCLLLRKHTRNPNKRTDDDLTGIILQTIII